MITYSLQNNCGVFLRLLHAGITINATEVSNSQHLSQTSADFLNFQNKTLIKKGRRENL